MGQTPFDLEAIRRNWARTIAPPKGRVPPRLATVEAPRDVPKEVRELVGRIRDLAQQQYPQRQDTLEPFFLELARLAELLGEPDDPAAKEKPAEQMAALLCEMEDLLDAFATIKR